MRGASFLIACVISSRGTHCIKSLIQQAAKGARSGSVRLLLISYTALMLPRRLYPSEWLELAQSKPLEGSRGGKGLRSSSASSLSFAVMSHLLCAREGRIFSVLCVFGSHQLGSVQREINCVGIEKWCFRIAVNSPVLAGHFCLRFLFFPSSKSLLAPFF